MSEVRTKIVLLKQNASLVDILEWMKQKGSSVLLNWGEDNNLWECSWITGDKRYTGFSIYLSVAICNCLEKVAEDIENKNEL